MNRALLIELEKSHNWYWFLLLFQLIRKLSVFVSFEKGSVTFEVYRLFIVKSGINFPSKFLISIILKLFEANYGNQNHTMILIQKQGTWQFWGYWDYIVDKLIVHMVDNDLKFPISGNLFIYQSLSHPTKRFWKRS